MRYVYRAPNSNAIKPNAFYHHKYAMVLLIVMIQLMKKIAIMFMKVRSIPAKRNRQISIKFLKFPVNLFDLFLVPCGSHEFQCNNGLCIDSETQCDGHKDCLDGSDELKCHSCQSGTFQ